MVRRSWALTPALAFLPLIAAAQQNAPLSLKPSSAAPDPSVYVSGQAIAERVAQAESAMRSRGPSVSEASVLAQPPFEITMLCRRGPASTAFTDEANADLYLVLGGSGTVNVGGRLVAPRRAEGILTGSKIEGGAAYNVHKGDILMVPPNTAQFVSRTEGMLAMLSIHVPMGDPSLWPGGNGFFAATGDPDVYISERDVAGRMAKADEAIASGLPDRGPFTLLSQPPFRVTMDDRIVPNGHVDAHLHSSELFVVLDGSGTLVVGGKMKDPKGQDNSLMAPSTEGGTLYKVSKGDLVLVPVGAAHAVTLVNGKLTLIQVHIPPAREQQAHAPIAQTGPGDTSMP